MLGQTLWSNPEIVYDIHSLSHELLNSNQSITKWLFLVFKGISVRLEQRTDNLPA